MVQLKASISRLFSAPTAQERVWCGGNYKKKGVCKLETADFRVRVASVGCGMGAAAGLLWGGEAASAAGLKPPIQPHLRSGDELAVQDLGVAFLVEGVENHLGVAL